MDEAPIRAGRLHRVGQGMKVEEVIRQIEVLVGEIRGGQFGKVRGLHFRERGVGGDSADDGERQRQHENAGARSK